MIIWRIAYGQGKPSAEDWGNADGGDGVAVQNVFEMASIVYAEIAGETVHEGSIIENNVPSFVTTTPISVDAFVDNNGNVHETATVTITAKNAITGEVILPTEENKGSYAETVMPETERLIEHQIDGLPVVGIVNVTQSVYYNGDVSVAEKTVIICPIWFMVTVAVVFGAIVGLIARAIVKRNKKRKSV